MPRLSLREAFGLSPLPLRLQETALALRGDANIPSTRWGLSSLGIFKPRISLPTWLGVRRRDRRVPIYNLFNRTPTPPTEGWSVRRTQVRDYRGGTWTYDSHNGTDFAIPVGTAVVAPAGGRIIRVSSEFHRGGLKVFIDHGHGIVTSCNHLGRSLVSEGDTVKRGDPIAISGYSGIDGVISFPWVAPHVHFNAFLDGRHTDPFAATDTDEVSLWLDGEPLPATEEDTDDTATSRWSADGVAKTLAGCKDETLATRLRGESLEKQAAELLFYTTYFPTLFSEVFSLYEQQHERRQLLRLPFRREDFVGAYLPSA